MSFKRRKKKKAAQTGKILLGLGFFIVAVFAVYVIQLKQSVVNRDKITQCRLDGKIARETALVIDATDSFSATQSILVKKEIEAMLETSVVDEKITLFVLGENVSDNIDRFSICNPGDGSDKSELTSNKRMLRQKWEALFYQRVVDAVDNLTGEHNARQSPILEMVKFVSVKTMYDSSALEKRIIIVSDMLHHTQEYSQYRQKPDYKSFEGTSYALGQKPYLSGVDTTILYLVRPQDMVRQNRGHIRFWESYVAANGGIISRVKTIN